MAEIKPKNNYFFPDFLGTAMSKVTVKVQLEAALMSVTLIMVGLILSGAYIIFYTKYALWYKLFLLFNIFAGLLFMVSNLITTFQMYRSHCEILDFQKKPEDIKVKKFEDNTFFIDVIERGSNEDAKNQE